MHMQTADFRGGLRPLKETSGKMKLSIDNSLAQQTNCQGPACGPECPQNSQRLKRSIVKVLVE